MVQQPSIGQSKPPEHEEQIHENGSHLMQQLQPLDSQISWPPFFGCQHLVTAPLTHCFKMPLVSRLSAPGQPPAVGLVPCVAVAVPEDPKAVGHVVAPLALVAGAVWPHLRHPSAPNIRTHQIRIRMRTPRTRTHKSRPNYWPRSGRLRSAARNCTCEKQWGLQGASDPDTVCVLQIFMEPLLAALDKTAMNN